jgi:hypothetical protein
MLDSNQCHETDRASKWKKTNAFNHARFDRGEDAEQDETHGRHA